MLRRKRGYILGEDDKLLLKQLAEIVMPLKKRTIKHLKLSSKLEMKQARVGDSSKVLIHAGNNGGAKKPYDYKLDLHGLSLQQAFNQFKGIIERSYYNKLRVILVVTGKGKNSEKGSGLIKREFVFWTELPEIKDKISGVSVADIKHGGDGAFYVSIKRSKK